MRLRAAGRQTRRAAVAFWYDGHAPRSGSTPARTSRMRRSVRKRGRLRIFFGVSAGVGKTYAMLEAARAARSSGDRRRRGLRRAARPGRDGAAARGAGAAYRHSRCTIAAWCARNSISTRRCAASRRFCSSMSSRIRISVGGDPAPRHPKRWQDVEELLRPASASGPRSMFSTWRV